MIFANRQAAAGMLAQLLQKYQGKDAVVLALPRGGVVLGVELAKRLDLPLDLLVARKIGHPFSREYAIAAVTESEIIKNDDEVDQVDPAWFESSVAKQRAEAKRRHELYLDGQKPVQVKNRIAIVVDDGIATGMTMQAALKEVKKRQPKKIVVAVPVVAAQTAFELGEAADEVVAIETPKDFMGSVGSYYASFPQISDEEVIDLMRAAGIA